MDHLSTVSLFAPVWSDGLIATRAFTMSTCRVARMWQAMVRPLDSFAC